ASLANLLANSVVTSLVASFIARLADRFAVLFAVCFVAGLVDGVVAFLHDGLPAGPRDTALLGLPFGLTALAIAGALFGAVASLADRLHHCLADGLVADVKTFFGGGVPHELVAGLGLLLAGIEAALRITGRL